MGPCSWPISYAQCASCVQLDAMVEIERATFEEMATTYLWNWTGQVYGLCEVSLRPCRQDCNSARGGYQPGAMWNPALVSGRWLNMSCAKCGDNCSCNLGTLALRLPGPVSSVEQVLIDGGVVDPYAYRVDNHSLLVRTDGGAWPTCQDMSLPSTDPGTWQINYTQGAQVPMGGQIAAGVLACELAKAACNDTSCALPKRLQAITRQGVTIAVLDSGEGLDRGKTGIWLIDSWVTSVTLPKRPGRVYSVDVPRPRNRTQTWPTPAAVLNPTVVDNGDGTSTITWS